MKRLFVCYRHEDTGPTALRLHERLRAEFGEQQVFADVQIEAAERWPQRIATEIAAADAALVLQRRLDIGEDWVLWVDGAPMPVAPALPAAILGLAERNTRPLRNREWESDVAEAIAWLESRGFERQRRVPAPPDPKLAPEPVRRSSGPIRRPLLVGAGASLAVLCACWLLWREAGVLVASMPLLGAALVAGFRGRPVLELEQEPTVPDAMVWIPGGTFLMGSADNDPQAHDNEKPQHEVRVAPFLLWRTPLTRGEYRSVMPAAEVPKEWTEPEDDRLPANYVDFYATVRCCNALSAKAELTPYYAIDGTSVRALGGPGYRLPSEAEWEHACRAGTTTQYGAGDQEADLARVGWYVANSEDRVHPVAAKPANAHGLHDMHGNVWEWCEDTWHGSYQGAPTDGRAWVDSASPYRVLRGGSFGYSAWDARSAYRYGVHLVRRNASVGFRPARSVSPLNPFTPSPVRPRARDSH